MIRNFRYKGFRWVSNLPTNEEYVKRFFKKSGADLRRKKDKR